MKTKRLPNQVPASLKSINVKAVLRSRGVYLQQKVEVETQKVKEQLIEAARPLARQLIAARKQVTPQRHHQFSNDEINAYWEKQIHLVEVLEDKFELKVQQFIGKVVNSFLSHLESEIATTKRKQQIGKAKDFFEDNENDLMVQAQFDLTPLLNDMAVLAGQEALKLIKSQDVYTPFDLRGQISKNVEKFTKSMLDTDRDTLINIVTNGIENGDSVAAIRGAIQADFESITKNQAQRVTRTEVLRVSNQAAIDAWQQSGVVEGKQWLTAGASDECSQYEGQVESLDGNFYDDTSEFLDGDPPLHPNCRCVLVPVVIGEKAYMPAVNKELYARITELEGQIDKRTKEYREIKEAKTDSEIYIKLLEKALEKRVVDTPSEATDIEDNRSKE